jgi:hypothetical protein
MPLDRSTHGLRLKLARSAVCEAARARDLREQGNGQHENAFDVIVVHSFSRFFRDAFWLEFYVR